MSYFIWRRPKTSTVGRTARKGGGAGWDKRRLNRYRASKEREKRIPQNFYSPKSYSNFVILIFRYQIFRFYVRFCFRIEWLSIRQIDQIAAPEDEFDKTSILLLRYGLFLKNKQQNKIWTSTLCNCILYIWVYKSI